MTACDACRTMRWCPHLRPATMQLCFAELFSVLYGFLCASNACAHRNIRYTSTRTGRNHSKIYATNLEHFRKHYGRSYKQWHQAGSFQHIIARRNAHICFHATTVTSRPRKVASFHSHRSSGTFNSMVFTARRQKHEKAASQPTVLLFI